MNEWIVLDGHERKINFESVEGQNFVAELLAGPSISCWGVDVTIST